MENDTNKEIEESYNFFCIAGKKNGKGCVLFMTPSNNGDLYLSAGESAKKAMEMEDKILITKQELLKASETGKISDFSVDNITGYGIVVKKDPDGKKYSEGKKIPKVSVEEFFKLMAKNKVSNNIDALKGSVDGKITPHQSRINKRSSPKNG